LPATSSTSMLNPQLPLLDSEWQPLTWQAISARL
jgi:hypothetical protein